MFQKLVPSYFRYVGNDWLHDAALPLAVGVTLRAEVAGAHSAGLNYPVADANLARWSDKFKPARKDGELIPVERLWAGPLGYQPGTGWMYGGGVDCAGRLVERATGCALGQQIQDRIFTPLGITEAEFYAVSRDNLRCRQVDLNPTDPDGCGIAVAGDIAKDNKILQGHFGGHGLFMTAIDFVKILQSLLANDGKLFKPSTVDDMFTHHLSPEATIVHQIVLTSPLGEYFRAGFDIAAGVGVGLGGLLTLDDMDRCYGRNTLTWGGGLTLTWLIDRTKKLCAIGAIQATMPVDLNTMTSLKQVFRRSIYEQHGRT